MSLDLLLVSIVIFSAMLGAILGASRQVAQWCALAAAYAAARPLGPALGPKAAEALHAPLVLGTVAATVGVFLLTLFVVRFALTQILRSFFAGRHSQREGFDRFLGCVLGGAKAAAVAYVILSALTFVEDHVTLAGKKLGFGPKSSYALQLARQYNLFELTQFAPVKDLARVAQGLQKPASAERLRADPAFRALMTDPRFQKVMSDSALRGRLARGDSVALLKNDNILRLVQDKVVAARLNAAAAKTEEEQ